MGQAGRLKSGEAVKPFPDDVPAEIQTASNAFPNHTPKAVPQAGFAR
ncbi:hypothetical protein [Neisseria chenwenguii]|nr:hypothetical protein [Neisseria chenwenguii]